MDYKSFTDRLLAVETEPHRFFIIDPENILEVYFGLNRNSQPTLLIEDVGEGFLESAPTSTAQIQVNVTKKNKGVELTFSLIDVSHREVFNFLCYDLFESTNRSTRNEALHSLLTRFAAWCDLLKGIRPKVMSIQQQQGLIAELFEIKLLSEGRSISNVLNAWVGPIGADKDFELGDCWLEIKSCKVDAMNITITSLEQLESQQDGYLVIYYIDKNTPNTSESFSLKHIVDDVRELIKLPSDRWMFEQKLLMIGYNDDELAYQRENFRLNRRETYLVNSKFPRISRNNLSPAIVNAMYELGIASIKSFLV